MAGRPWPSHLFFKSSDFQNCCVLLENFWTFAVDKDKGFKFYCKIFELGPLPYKCHNTFGVVAGTKMSWLENLRKIIYWGMSIRHPGVLKPFSSPSGQGVDYLCRSEGYYRVLR